MGSGANLSLTGYKALHQTLQLEVLVTAAPQLAWALKKTPRKGHWTSTKTCHVLFLISYQSPSGHGVGGTGTAEQSRGHGSWGELTFVRCQTPRKSVLASTEALPRGKGEKEPLLLLLFPQK